jgi:hypothetical protein
MPGAHYSGISGDLSRRIAISAGPGASCREPKPVDGTPILLAQPSLAAWFGQDSAVLIDIHGPYM